jgi:hypothetical protein
VLQALQRGLILNDLAARVELVPFPSSVQMSLSAGLPENNLWENSSLAEMRNLQSFHPGATGQ